MPKHLALFVFATIQGAGFTLAVGVDSAATGFLFAAVFGFGNGGRNPLVTAIRGDYFGKRAFATITGISTAPLYILTLVAPLFAAALFDIRDSYTIPFSVLGALGLLSGFLFLMARRPAYPTRPGAPVRRVTRHRIPGSAGKNSEEILGPTDPPRSEGLGGK